MSMAALIRRHIRDLSDSQMFASKHLLQYANRGVVDGVLFKMVQDGLIIRLARGVFVKPHQNISSITLQQIAEFKASIFSRQLVTYALNAAKELGLSERGSVNTFATSGRTSSFRVFCHHNTVVKLRGICPRKVQEARVGLAMRALWHLGKKKCTPLSVELATEHFGRLDRQEMHTIAPVWMPGWLHDLIFMRRNNSKPPTPAVKEDGGIYAIRFDRISITCGHLFFSDRLEGSCLEVVTYG